MGSSSRRPSFLGSCHYLICSGAMANKYTHTRASSVFQSISDVAKWCAAMNNSLRRWCARPRGSSTVGRQLRVFCFIFSSHSRDCVCVGGIYDAAGAKVALSRVYKKKGLSIYITGGKRGRCCFQRSFFLLLQRYGGSKRRGRTCLQPPTQSTLFQLVKKIRLFLWFSAIHPLDLVKITTRTWL